MWCAVKLPHTEPAGGRFQSPVILCPGIVFTAKQCKGADDWLWDVRHTSCVTSQGQGINLLFVICVFYSGENSFKASVFWWAGLQMLENSELLNLFSAYGLKRRLRYEALLRKVFYSIQALWIFFSVEVKKKEKNKKMQIHGSSVAACSTFCGKLWCLKTRILSAAALMQPFTASGDELLLSLQLLRSVS